MPNNPINPSLSAALQQAFNKPQTQAPDQSGLWKAILGKLQGGQPDSQPAQPSPSPYGNLANKATGLPYK